MKKKLFIPFTLLILFAASLHAQPAEGNTVSGKAKLEEATIFHNGAELRHTATLMLNQGVNTVEISGLSPVIDKASLRIKAPDGVVISSYDYKTEFVPEGKVDEKGLKQIRDSIEIVNGQISQLNVKIRVNDQVLALLQSNVKSTADNDTPLSIEDLRQTLSYYGEEAVILEQRKLELSNEKAKLDAAVARLEEKYTRESVKNNRREGLLTVNLTAPVGRSTAFSVSYFTNQAGWYPHYDINVADIDRPVRFGLKSKVVQTTGLDWDKIKITLSTSTPTSGMVAPLFRAWFLEPESPNIRIRGTATPVAQNSLSYSRVQADEEVVVVGYGTQKKAAEPIYIINGMPATAEEYAMLSADMIENVEILKDASSTAIYGSRAANGVVLITTKTGLSDFIAVEDNAAAMVFNIDMPYSIPGNGREQTIDLDTREAEAEYKYYVAPKLDPQTFLVAEIPNWNKLGLMSGKANVTFNGTYLGETYIDASSTNENLTLTLGTDKRVVAQRLKIDDFSAKRTIGSDIQQTFLYRISVRNNNSRPVNMVVKDQYPRSSRKDVDVTFNAKETTKWTYNNEEVGVITWEETIASGETKSYEISYTVKYPKNMTLNLR